MTILKKHDWLASRPWIDRAEADIDAYVAKIKISPGYRLRKKLYEWKERGIVIFENVVNGEWIDALLSDIDHLRKGHQDYELISEIFGEQKPISQFTPEELESNGVKFNSIHSISAAAAHLSLTEAVTSFLQHVFMSQPHVLQSLTFCKGSQQPKHIDYPYVRCQTKLAHLAASWIPLEDIHAESGPLVYYPGSHRPEISGFFDWGEGGIVMDQCSKRTPDEFANYLDIKIAEAGIQPEIFLPKRGDVLIWHGNLVHQGSPIKNRNLTRKSYVTHYTSRIGYPSAHRRRDRKGLAKGAGVAYDYPWLDEFRKLLPSSI